MGTMISCANYNNNNTLLKVQYPRSSVDYKLNNKIELVRHVSEVSSQVCTNIEY